MLITTGSNSLLMKSSALAASMLATKPLFCTS